MNNKIYTKIPLKLLNIENKNNTKDDKMLLLIYYLNLNINSLGYSNVSINYLINKCEYYNNDNVKSEFKLLLNRLQELDYINIGYDTNLLRVNDLIEIDMKRIINMDNNYILLLKDEFEKIKNSISSKKEFLNILRVFLYLKYQYTSNKFEIFSYSNKNISSNTNTSERCITGYIDKLKELQMINYKNLGKVYNIQNEVIQCDNIYIITGLCDKDIEEEKLNIKLECQKEYWRDKGYSILNNNFKVYYDDLENLTLKGVYLIRNLYNNTLKIGICSNLNKRFNEIKGSFKFCGLEPNLKIECFIETNNNYIIEQFLHKEFEDVNYQNEWFNIDNINIVLEKIEEFK